MNNMKLPRFTASTPAQGTGLVRANDIGALTNTGGAQYKAMAEAGKVIGDVVDIGFKAYMHRQELDDIIESGVATQRVEDSWSKVNDTVNVLNPMADMPLPDDPNYNKTLTALSKSKIDKMLPDLLKGVEKDASKVFANIHNKKTRAKLINQYNQNYTNKVKTVKSNLNTKLNDYQLSEMNKLAESSALNGDLDISDYYVDRMAEHGLISYTKASSLKKDYNKLFLDTAETNSINAVHESIEMATDPETGTGNFSIPKELAKNKFIPESKQTTLRNTIKVNENEYNRTGQIRTNQLVKGDIEEQGHQLWLGTVELDDYEETLKVARYGKVVGDKVQYSFGDITSNKPLIDDTAYDELRTLGTKELKSSQAKGLSNASNYAKGQLIRYESELGLLEALKGLNLEQQEKIQTRRQVELDNWNQFNQSMKIWQAKNPDAVESDYYVESRKKLPFYRTRTEDDIKGGKLPGETLTVNKDISAMTDDELLKKITGK